LRLRFAPVPVALCAICPRSFGRGIAKCPNKKQGNGPLRDVAKRPPNDESNSGHTRSPCHIYPSLSKCGEVLPKQIVCFDPALEPVGNRSHAFLRQRLLSGCMWADLQHMILMFAHNRDFRKGPTVNRAFTFDPSSAPSPSWS
jgi:hypothetical protein